MEPREQERIVIAELHLAGNDAKAIIKYTNYPRATIYEVVKRLQPGRGIGHVPIGSHRAKKPTPMFLAGLKRSIKANPRCPYPDPYHWHTRPGDPRTVRLFSDESIFTVDGAYNPKNDRWLATIMAFGLASSDRKVMPTQVFPPNFWLNTAEYVELLEKVVMPLLATSYPPHTKFMWIHDSVPCHISNISMEYLNRRVGQQGRVAFQQPRSFL